MSTESTQISSQTKPPLSRNPSTALPRDSICVQKSPCENFMDNSNPRPDEKETKSLKLSIEIENFCQKKMASSSFSSFSESFDSRDIPCSVCCCLDVSAVSETPNGSQSADLSEEKRTEEIKKSNFSDCDSSSRDLIQGDTLNSVISATSENRSEQQDTTEMMESFEEILKTSPTDLRALAGSALIEFQRCNYTKSLERFRKILRHYPASTAEIRMWIGCCLCKLGNFDKAKLAFERALNLDENCVGGKVGVAFLTALDGKTAESISLLTTVMEDSADAVVPALENFSDEFCVALDLSASLSVVELVLDKMREEKSASKEGKSVSKEEKSQLGEEKFRWIQAIFAWKIAKRFHFLENFDSAFEFYQIAADFSPPDFFFPLFGLGQIYLHRLDFPKAVQSFEAVLEISPDCVEAMKILGLIYNRLGCFEKKFFARNYLTKAAEKFPENSDVLFKLAEELESVDKEKSLKTYLTVYELQKSNGISSDFSVQLLNNISAVCFVLKDFHQSNEFLTLAFERLENDVNFDLDHSMKTTLLYNKGRIFEIFSDWNSAEDCYLKVLAAHPAYIDAYLRLGHVANAKGDPEDADFWLTEAALLDPENPESSIFQADFFSKNENFEAAREKFQLILKNHSDETFVMLKFADSCVASFQNGISNAEKKRDLVEKAFSHFQEVLRFDSTNPYAVNGMGVVLASTGFGNAAMEMFRLVQECNPHVIDAWLNMGHCYCSLKDYGNAIEVYQKASTLVKNSAPDSEIHLYLARAFYLNGDFGKAERTLQTALRISPNSRILKFNLGLVLKAKAIVTLKDKNSGLVAVENAVGDLKTAEAVFRALILDCKEDGKTKSDLIDQKRLRKEAAVTFNFLNQSASHLERAERMEALAAKKQKRTANQLLVTDQFSIRKNDRGKREVASASSSGTKGKMARQQTRAEDYSPMKKRSHKNAQLEEGLVDFKQVLSNTQREPQRKRVKAVLGDGNDRRRRRFADRKRRELEIERTTVSSDEDLSPKFRPLRRRCLQGLQTGNVSVKKALRLNFDDSSDACSTAADVSDNAENEVGLFSVQKKFSFLAEAATQLIQRRRESAPQKRVQSSSEKPTVLKKFLKSLSDEANSVHVTNAEITTLKKNFSDGDESSVPVKEEIIEDCQIERNQLVRSVPLTPPAPFTPSAPSVELIPVISVVDSDDSAKRQNTDSEPESRKRKSSLHLS